MAQGEEPVFDSHTGHGSAVPSRENIAVAPIARQSAKARTVMEMEIGVVGGEGDGVTGEMNEKL